MMFNFNAIHITIYVSCFLMDSEEQQTLKINKTFYFRDIQVSHEPIHCVLSSYLIVTFSNLSWVDAYFMVFDFWMNWAENIALKMKNLWKWKKKIEVYWISSANSTVFHICSSVSESCQYLIVWTQILACTKQPRLDKTSVRREVLACTESGQQLIVWTQVLACTQTTEEPRKEIPGNLEL